MSNYFSIFSQLDSPRKYYGATLLEIATVASFVLAGFLLDKLAICLVLSVLSFKLVRVVSHSDKTLEYKKCLFFHSEDLKTDLKKYGRFLL